MAKPSIEGRLDGVDELLKNMDQRLDGIQRDLSRHTWLSVSTIAIFGLILTAIELFG